MSSLQERYKDLIKNNEAKSYSDYLSQNGIRAEEKYYDTLSKADTDMAVKDTNYGAKASYLHSSGLNKSGYEEYLRGKNAKSYFTSLNQASEEKSIDEYKNKTGYQNYLSDYESIQTKIAESVMKKIASGNNFSFEDAYAEALRAGVSGSLAYVTAQNGISKARQKTIKRVMQYAEENNLTAQQAREYALELGLEEVYADRIHDSIPGVSLNDESFYSGMSAAEYYEYIKSKANK